MLGFFLVYLHFLFVLHNVFRSLDTTGNDCWLPARSFPTAAGGFVEPLLKNTPTSAGVQAAAGRPVLLA